MAFPIARRRDVVMLFEKGSAGAEEAVDLGLAPDIELAFLMLAIGIEAAAEAALGAHHLARNPVHRLGDALGEEGAARLLPDKGHQIDQLGIVVEHLLEM